MVYISDLLVCNGINKSGKGQIMRVKCQVDTAPTFPYTVHS